MLHTDSPIKTGRKVYTGYEIGVNYIVHLFTLANAGFSDEGYVKQFSSVVSPEGREVLQENAKLMTFAKGDRGPFACSLYFLPCYHSFQSKQEYETYFGTWSQAIDEKDFTPLGPYSQGGILQNFFIEEWKNMNSSNYTHFQKLAEVFIHNFDNYKNEVWPNVEPALDKHSKQVNESFLSLPHIDLWEEATGYSFGDHDYFISFFYAGKNGPSFNNVSLHKNTAYYNQDANYQLDMIIHELGIHILLPHVQELINQFQREIPRIKSPYIYGNVSYMAFESLATFYNRKVLGRYTYDFRPHNDPLAFMEIYDTLYQSGITDPSQLYKQGVLEYVKPGGYSENGIQERYIKLKG